MTITPRELELLDRYVDGLLSPPERAEFERRLAVSLVLRERVELQGRIDAGLRRLFERGEGAGAAGVQTAAPPVVRRLRLAPALAAAAAVVLVAAGVWWWGMRPPSGPDPLEAEYRRIVSTGFTPQVVCTTDAEFRGWVHNKFGEPLQPKPDRGPVQYVGWNSARILSSYSGMLLARAEGQQVVVLIDRKHTEDQRLPNPEDPSLHQFRRTIGGLVLYEITPLDHPAVLDSLAKP